jgi:hypothetical protein
MFLDIFNSLFFILNNNNNNNAVQTVLMYHPSPQTFRRAYLNKLFINSLEILLIYLDSEVSLKEFCKLQQWVWTPVWSCPGEFNV